MKKFSLFFCCLAAFTLISCNSDIKEQAVSPDREICILTAYADAAGNSNKTSLVEKADNSGLSVFWTPGDAISIFFNDGTGGGDKFSTQDSGPVAGFSGYMPEETADDMSYWALYPYNPDASFDGTAITTTLPSEQRSPAGNVQNGLMVTAGRSDEMSVQFRNTCCVVPFTVSQSNIKQIILSGNNGESLAGEYKISFDDAGNVSSTPTANALGSISITPAASTSFVPGTTYYFVTLPCTCSNGLSVTYKKTDRTEATYSIGTSFTFARSAVQKLTRKDEDLTFVPSSDPAPVFEDLGSFNIVNSGMSLFLDDVEREYAEDGSDWKTFSLVTETNRSKYGFGKDGDLADYGKTPVANDKPAPVKIPVNGYNGSNVTVTVFNDEYLTEVENTITATVAGGYADVFNLIPGRTYWSSVTYDGETLGTYKFATTGRRRIIKISDVIYADRGNNCRDLGGIPTMDGRHLKYNKIFRGSNVDEITDAEKSILTGYMNVGLDVDLRSTSGGSRNKAQQILTGIGFDSQSYSGATDLKTAAKMKATMTNIFNTVASGKSCYIHCFAGADRTGYICALIEALCGVSLKQCTIDYELTSFSCVNVRDRTGVLKKAAFTETFPYLVGYSGSTLQEKAENILISYGITREQITTFQNAMVE